MAITYGLYGDERSLVRACQAGEDAALRSFYKAFFPGVYRYVLASIGNPHDAEDVTAEVFVKALMNIERYRDQSRPVTAWVYRIARNEVADHYRRASRRIGASALDVQQTGADERYDPVEVQDLLIDLAAALRRLPAPHREAVVLRLVAGLSTRAAAAAMVIPEGTLRSHLHYGIRALRAALKEER